MSINDRYGQQQQPGVPVTLLPDSIKTAIDAGQRLAKKDIYTPALPHATPFIVVRDGDGAESVEYVNLVEEAPRQKAGTQIFHDAKSFGAYWTRHAGPDSILYAVVPPHGDLSFTAVFDEHTAEGPHWREHRATYTPMQSVEWKLWREQNKKKFEGNVAFAEWLEDAYFDIVEPSGADMLQIALTFNVSKAVAFSNASRLSDGHTELQYNEVVTGGAGAAGKVKIPNFFRIEIPLFAGLDQPKYPMEARFKYRLTQGALSIWYELVRPHKAIEIAAKELIGAVEKSTGASVLYGIA